MSTGHRQCNGIVVFFKVKDSCTKADRLGPRGSLSEYEYENETLSRLGSVVTNHGHSDWATTDIATTTIMWYRLSRRGPDFLIEHASDGERFQQMRIFDLHCFGETTVTMGKADAAAVHATPMRFEAYFDHCDLSPSLWAPHGED